MKEKIRKEEVARMGGGYRRIRGGKGGEGNEGR
jgi:hypothetical protein